MVTMAAREAKNRFGEMLDTAQHEPVAITKNGRVAVIVLSKRTFTLLQQRLDELEDAVRTARG